MLLFHLKFAVTIFIKVYSKMWGLWMHLDYDHFYIPLTSKQGKFQPQAIIFPVKKAYCCVVKISEKNIIFSSLRSCYYNQTNGKKLILPLKNTSKLCMTIVTASTYLFESFTFFQSGWGNVVEIQEFDATSRALYCIWTYTAFDYRTLPPFVRKLYKALFQCKTLKKGID